MDEVVAQRQSGSDAHPSPKSPAIGSLVARQPTPQKRRLVAALCIAYFLAMLCLVPFSRELLPALPAFTGIFATAVVIVDICTFVLLAAQFRVGREPWLLILGSAYLFSGILAALHLFTFPGAVLPGSPLIGPPQTVVWLYIFWTFGFILILFASVLWHAFGENQLRPEKSADAVLLLTAMGVLGVAGLLYVVAAKGWLPAGMIGDQFSPLNRLFDHARSLLGAVALVVLWRSKRSRTSTIYLWLSLALVAAITAPLVTSLGGQRYTFGWYAGRLGFTFASSVLLCVLLSEVVMLQHALARSVASLKTQAKVLQEEIERRELTERQLMYAQKMEAIGRVAGGVSHDFNNLLGAMVSYLELILKMSKEEPIRKLAEKAKQVSMRGARLTRSLVAFAQRQPLHTEIIRIDEILHRFEVLMQKAVGDSVTFSVVSQPDTWPVFVDPDQLEIALLNLALNSRDAMAGGGVITISSANVHSPRLGVSNLYGVLPPGDYVVISVADTGEGIPVAQLDKVFDPFFTTKEIGKGSGLGLSQVRGFVRQSGGEVVIQSTPGDGAKVSLYFPRAHPKALQDQIAAEDFPRPEQTLVE